jgi:hypothetical protein
MRTRFRISALLGTAALAGSMVMAGGTAFASTDPGGASTATTMALVNVKAPGPVAGSQTCITLTPGCIDVPGIANLSVAASATVDSIALPTITLTSAPGCTGQVSVGAVVTPGLASGVVSIVIQYDLTDAKGNVLPDSQTTIIKSVPFSAGEAPVVVTECASTM